MEIVRLPKLNALPYYFYIKGSLLIIGILTSSLALQTGEMAEDLVSRDLHNLVETHATFANISTWIFAILAIVYAIIWISKTEYSQKLNESVFAKIWNIKLNIANKIFNNTALIVLLSIAGLGAITITGALGGAIVYGPDVDPIVSFFYYLIM
jgi:hypothetical protein